LSTLTFDVSNATGIFTNQEGFLSGQFYDTNLLAFTTNYFQCSDVDLGNGTNRITLHATDWAGNTANVSFTLNYSPSTNPPALAIVWPQTNMKISGDNFTVQAQVDSTAAKITASIVDSSGDTNIVQGFAEKNGTAWIQNMPLNAGTNSVTVTATGLNGSTSTTNFSVIKNDVGLVIYPLESYQLNQSSVSVFGEIGDTNLCVWVNGVQATVNDDGSWEADSVPVSPVGTANLSVQVYVGDPVLVASQNFYQAQPVTVGMMSYSGRHDMGFFGSGTETINWSYDTGGNYIGDEYSAEISTNENGLAYIDFGWLTLPFQMPWEYASVTTPQFYGPYQYSYGNYTQTRVMVEPSGQALAGTTNLYLVLAYASEFSTSQMEYGPEDYTYGWDYEHLLAGIGSTPDYEGYFGDTPLPPEWLQINGKTLINAGITNSYTIYDGGWSTFNVASGETIVAAPAGVNWDVTPVATQVYQNQAYTFNVQAFDVTPRMLVDINRDGNVDSLTTPNSPYRFWLNNFSEGGDISSASSQIPGNGGANYTGSYVNGASDLVNFFPVALCLSNALQLLPPTNGYEYHLSQADSAVKFVYTSLTPTNAFDYLTNVDNATYYAVGSGFGVQAAAASTFQVTSSGVALSPDFLNLIATNGSGVILVEGCNYTTKPLMLEIWLDGQKLGGVPLFLSITNVEQMYRQKNLRDGADAPSGLSGDLSVRDSDPSLPTSMGEPSGMPDSDLSGRWSIFVVGSNVGGQNSRGWESEVFKRMYWSGNKAKFVGVSWYGDPYTNSEGVYDYHMAVRNAFATAPSLASFVNGLSGAKTIAGHSLGCGLIASAIADQGMNVNNACLMDAAIALECFDGNADVNLTAMQPSAWSGYSEGLFAANWHEQFSNDARTNLTWNGRFSGAVGNVYNFYSSTEDALGEYDGDVPTSALEALIISGTDVQAYVWTYQEKAKGNRQDYYVPVFPGHFHVGSTYGGWGFNIFDGYLTNYPTWYDVAGCNCSRSVKTPAEIGTVTTNLLAGSRYNPLFKSGWGAFNADNAGEIYVNTDTTYFTGPSWILGLYDPVGGNTIASNTDERNQLLAEAIPALSLPVGANKCSSILDSKQFNMAAQFADAAHWPSPRGATSGIPNWWHSDMDQVAYLYLYKFYNQIVSISNQ
jgi:hypothetical protein